MCQALCEARRRGHSQALPLTAPSGAETVVPSADEDRLVHDSGKAPTRSLANEVLEIVTQALSI